MIHSRQYKTNISAQKITDSLFFTFRCSVLIYIGEQILENIWPQQIEKLKKADKLFENHTSKREYLLSINWDTIDLNKDDKWGNN
jgi:hypothetical protein